MKFLCIHGACTNPTTMKKAMWPLLREFEDDKDIKFEFAQGMLEYPPPEGFERELGDPPHLRFFEWELPAKYLGARVHPTRDVTQASVEDVIREHFQPQDPFCMELALEYLQLVIEQEGPFEGLIGWSEGAAVAATLLLHDFAKCDRDRSTSKFKCAIFFAGSPPFTLDGKNVLLHDQYGQVIRIPTCHVLGQSDAMFELADALFNICDSRSAIAIRDEGGHRISRDPDVIKKLVNFIKEQSLKDQETIENMTITRGLPTMNGVSAQGHLSKHDIMPIAIVGMGCRFPGGASSPERLWDLCFNARTTWSEVPKDRFHQESFFHPNPDRNNCTHSHGGHFLENDLSRFDAQFFSMTANEAKAVDPQQRLVLECAYEALENAGIPLHTIVGQNIGVFVGGSFSEYAVHMMRDTETIPTYHMTGTDPAILSNRVSYIFGLHGPSLTVDTACSSSLTAVHLACQSLRAGESKQAIVGGTHLNILPDRLIAKSNIRLLSSQGKSFAFDSRANGFGPGEGAGCLILKPLEDAIKAGDPIRAVIRNSGINQDGRTKGLTLPSGEAQEALSHHVYHSAGLNPAETDYVETHGTGTAVGDLVEAQAVDAVFGHGRSPKKPIYVGSVKSNVGHAEGASGIVSMIKAVMMLERGYILPNANFEMPNPEIAALRQNMKISTVPFIWPDTAVRRASVSNFGFGGSNAHIVLEEAPSTRINRVNGKSAVNGFTPGSMITGQRMGNGHPNPIMLDHETPIASPEQSKKLLVLAANDKKSLNVQQELLSSYLKDHSRAFNPMFMENLAFTLGQRRSLLAWKVAYVTDSRENFVQKLEQKNPTPLRTTKEPELAFVFTGQGAQWYRMGRELIHAYPVFASTIDTITMALINMGASYSLKKELMKDAKSSRLGEAFLSQPACTAIQIAMVLLLRSWGIRPTAVTGHSSGEIAAAFAADVLTLETCMSIAFHRGEAISVLKQQFPHIKGAMLALGASEAAAISLLDELGTSGQVAVACINSPSSVTLSGDVDAIHKIQEAADKKFYFHRKLHVDVAYHSHHMNLIAEHYRTAIGVVKPNASGRVQFVSSLTGVQINTLVLGSGYWVRNLVSPVKFFSAVQKTCAPIQSARQGEHLINVFIEIGPHSALQGPIKEILKVNTTTERKFEYLPSLIRNTNAVDSTLQLASTLFTMGSPIELSAVNFPSDRFQRPQVLSDLPTYSWNHENRYWHESRFSQHHRLRQMPRSDILGVLAIDSNDIEPRWRNIIKLDNLPWLRDHKVQADIIVPMSFFLAMALESAFQRATLRQIAFTKYVLREIVVGQALVIPESSEVETMLNLRPLNESSRASSDIWEEFIIFSWTAERGWIEHCRGQIGVRSDKDPNSVEGEEKKAAYEAFLYDQICNVDVSCLDALSCEKLYETYAHMGLVFGPSFQSMVECRVGKHSAVAQVKIPRTCERMPFQYESQTIIHPALLDSFFQLSYPILTNGLRTLTGTPLALRVKDLSISHRIRDISKGYFRVYGSGLSKSLVEQTIGSIAVMEPKADSRTPLIYIEGFTSTTLSNTSFRPNKGQSSGACWKTEWQPYIDLMTSGQIREAFQNPPPSEEDRRDLQRLEKASFMFIEKALAQLAKDEYNSFQNHHKQFYCWMQDQHAACSMNFTSSDLSGPHDDTQKDFLDIVRSSTSGGEILCKIGESIVNILRQDIDSASVFVESGLLSRFRDDLGSTKRNYRAASLLVNNLAHQNPGMRILEVRAGQGGATRPILDILGAHPGEPPRFERYDFSDLSTRLFEDAKRNLEAWSSFLNFTVLDVEKDPVRQGHAFETYDLVIISDSSHKLITSTRASENIRRLLKPGGKLLIMEDSRGQLLHFPFGLFPNLSTDKELEQTGSGAVEQDRWDAILKENGFSGIDCSVPDHPGESDCSARVLLSTAIAPEVHEIGSKVVIVSSKAQSTALGKMLKSYINEALPRFSKSIFLQDMTEMDLEDSICIFLDEKNPSILADPSSKDFHAVKTLCSSASGILWVMQGAQTETTNPFQNMATGLLRTIRNENAGLQLATLDIDGRDPNLLESSPEFVCRNIYKVFEKVFKYKSSASGFDLEYLEQGGVLHIPRIVESPQANQCLIRETEELSLEMQPFAQKDRPLRLTIESPGFLDSLYYLDDDTAKTPLQDEEIEIRVEATGVNFRDIMYAVGQISSEYFGGECSGTISALGSNISGFKVGDRVCALTRGGYSTLTRCSAKLATKIPDDVSFVVAASIPVAFSTAHYSLVETARLSQGESVLIHAAAGGVGQAAVRLAQWIGARVFATVGSPEKKAFLMETFKIPEGQIFSSRETSFVDHVKLATKGKGVDVVLNSLAGEALKASLDCLAHFGRFVEIGKQDLMVNTRMEMRKFTYNVTYMTVDLLLLQAEKTQLVQTILKKVTDLIFGRSISNVATINVFPTSQLEAAFRFMQSGRSMGKIVIGVNKGDQVKAIIPNTGASFLSKDATYLITGGSGGLGRSITKWFVDHGARYIVIASRSGAENQKVQDLVRELQVSGATVAIQKCDVSVRSQVEKLFEECSRTMPPIKGVLHGSAVFQDVIFERSSYEEYTNVVKPKVDGAWNLHQVFRDLEFFVMLGSVASIVGNRGQAAYSAASTFLSALAQHRIRQGLPAATISLGAVQGVGYIADNSTTQASMEKHLGLQFIDEKEVHVLIHAAIRTQTGTTSNDHEWISGLQLKLDNNEPFWLSDPKFAHLRRAQSAAQSEQSTTGQNASMVQQLKRAQSLREAQASVCNGLLAKISGVLMVPAEDVHVDAPMATYGLDSLVAVEIRNWIVRELGVGISVFDLLSGSTLRMVADLIVKKSKLVDRRLLQTEIEG